MNRKLLIGFFLSTLLAVGAFAQAAFTVSYLDGLAELQGAKAWQALSIGDQVPATGTVRVSQSGSLELQRGQTHITILKDGTYDMASLVKASSGGATATAGTGLTKKLQTLVTTAPASNAVGGVRGAEQGTSGSVTWVDETDETRTQVQDLLDKKQFTDALKVLNAALSDPNSGMDPGELNYLSGVAYYGAGQTARAYRSLTKVNAQADAPWYARYIILESQVLVDTQNYKDALAVLTPFIAAYPTGEATQMAYLLTYYSQKGLGDTKSASASLDAGFKLDPSTDTAKLIDQQRKAS
jgi:tetratricopeptide (TPR) repeat protein